MNDGVSRFALCLGMMMGMLTDDSVHRTKEELIRMGVPEQDIEELKKSAEKIADRFYDKNK